MFPRVRLNAGLRYVSYSKNNARTAVPFEDTATAYQAKKTSELFRHVIVFSVFTYEGVIQRSQKLVKIARNILGLKCFSRVMKMTIYGQFVAGENLLTIRPVIDQCRKNGVRAILDYAVEDDIPDAKVVLETRSKAADDVVHISQATRDIQRFPQFKPTVAPADTTVRASARTYFYATEKKCDDVMKNFLSCVNMAADTAEKGDAAFAAIKFTGLGRVEFLLKLSEMVEGTRHLFFELATSNALSAAQITPQSFYSCLRAKHIYLSATEADILYCKIDTEGKGAINFYDWINRFQPENELYKYFQSQRVFCTSAVMQDYDLKQMQSVVQRVHTIAECAVERNVRLMVDAEQTYFQPAIRHIVVHLLMPKYNQGRPLIFNTIQCYLKNAREVLQTDVEYSVKSGFSYGVKLVRGAYLEQERQGALVKGAPDPIWSCKAETDKCYNECVEYLMERIQKLHLQMMVATHNKESVKKTIELMRRYNVSKSDGSVVFGQLLGMCDHITFTLGKHGYIPYKYMPYGPVDDVIPYLIRRAYENKAMLEGADEERKLVRTELRRRLLAKLGVSH